MFGTSLTELEPLIVRVKIAQATYATFTQKQVDKNLGPRPWRPTPSACS